MLVRVCIRARPSGGINTWSLIRSCSDPEPCTDGRRAQRSIHLHSSLSAWLQQGSVFVGCCALLHGRYVAARRMEQKRENQSLRWVLSSVTDLVITSLQLMYIEVILLLILQSNWLTGDDHSVKQTASLMKIHPMTQTGMFPDEVMFYS